MSPFPGSPDKTRDSLLPKLALKPWVRDKAPRLILRNAKIVDPSEGALLAGLHDVVAEDGLIISMCTRTTEHEPKLPSIWDADSKDPKPIVVDLSGKYLCPGLIDCHVHVTAVPGVKTMSELVQTSEELIHLRTTYILREMLLRGFTTVRDTGGASKALAGAISEGLITGPRLFQCGKALSQTGGHADFGPANASTGCCGGHVQSLGRTCDGVPQVLKATREELKGGADFIKVMCGGGVASPTDAIETVQFTAEEIGAITTTCKQMGNKHTTAHAYTDASVLHAIENGVRGIEHGNLISATTAQLMAEKGVFLTPTLACYGIMVRPPFEDFLPPEGKVKNAQVMERGLDALKIADEAGVVPLISALPSVGQADPRFAARMLGDAKLGRIAVGCYADLLVLDADPLEDVTVLDYPEKHLFAVIQGGRVISSRIDALPVENHI
ncbi:hypothetical protein TRAPUB_3727 [Trametes pubescens]|uniref:Amidohydrolase-related domain-containing protein n=1 Tax=Trametes pubescens TaxID=154538 RepID=A0A1M2VD43_TRAPU|nr:hypothetical protein TRAPUB_3727 [Trametes pubescens]